MLRSLRASAWSFDTAGAAVPVARGLWATAFGTSLAWLHDFFVLAGDEWIVPIGALELLSPGACLAVQLPSGALEAQPIPGGALVTIGMDGAVDLVLPDGQVATQPWPGGDLETLTVDGAIDVIDPLADLDRRTA